MSTLDCDGFSELAPELALGALAGADRAQVLAHLDGCLSCRSSLDRLVEVSDALIELVKPLEPPAGFDVRVAAGLTPARGRPRRRPIQALAAATLVVAGGLAGWACAVTARPAQANPLEHARLTSRSGVAGQIFLYEGKPSWLYMTVHDPQGDEQLACVLDAAGGRSVRVGTFAVTDGYGYWSAPVPVGQGRIRDARVLTADGTVVATATFPGP